MNHANEQTPEVRPLPLTESFARTGLLGLVSEADIRSLVDLFYERVRGDDTLGPIFARHVTDWSLHLPKMYDFWSTVILKSGRYAGRPFEAHERIPGLKPMHFERWLALWEQTVNRVIDEKARGAFVIAAQRMAASISSRLGAADRLAR